MIQIISIVIPVIIMGVGISSDDVCTVIAGAALLIYGAIIL